MALMPGHLESRYLHEVRCDKQQQSERDEEKRHNCIATSRCHRTQLSVVTRVVLLRVLVGTVCLLLRFT